MSFSGVYRDVSMCMVQVWGTCDWRASPVGAAMAWDLEPSGIVQALSQAAFRQEIEG